jgi:hypothetical protein
VAAAASDAQRELIAGLLLITPWDRLEQVAAHHYPLLPVQWLLRDRYDSVAHLASFGRPVLVAIAADDSIVPPAVRPGPLCALANRNDWRSSTAPSTTTGLTRLDDAWWREAIDFLIS